MMFTARGTTVDTRKHIRAYYQVDARSVTLCCATLKMKEAAVVARVVTDIGGSDCGDDLIVTCNKGV